MKGSSRGLLSDCEILYLRGFVSSCSNRYYLATIHPFQDDVRCPGGVGGGPGPHPAPADGPAGVRAGAGLAGHMSSGSDQWANLSWPLRWYFYDLTSVVKVNVRNKKGEWSMVKELNMFIFLLTPRKLFARYEEYLNMYQVSSTYLCMSKCTSK